MKARKRKVVPLKELRFEPANSNDAARANLSHHFSQVPKCAFTKDDGISHYLASESGMEPAPTSPTEHVALHEDVPAVSIDDTAAAGKFNFRLLRDGFAAGIVLHVALAGALFFVTVPRIDEPTELEGVTVVSVSVEGSDANSTASGDAEALDKPVEPVEIPEQLQAKTEDIRKQVPTPALNAVLPDVLMSKDVAQPKIKQPAQQPVLIEKPIEQPVKEMTAVIPEKKIEAEARPEPVFKSPEPVEVNKAKEIAETEEKKIAEKKPEPKKEEPKPEPKKDEPKKRVEKTKPREKRADTKGNKGAAENNAHKGRQAAKNKAADAKDDSQGDANSREIGNSARSSYKGLVQKKIQRAKSRVRNSGKGTVMVAFTITASGDVSGARVTRSSGDKNVDAAALKIIDIAAPFPAIPAEAGRKSWPMTVPIMFK